MKGIRFYEEFNSAWGKRRKLRKGHVIAVYTNIRDPNVIDAVAAIFSEPDSPVSSCGVSPKYLRTNCRRISEAQARKIHPRLFEYLEKKTD